MKQTVFFFLFFRFSRDHSIHLLKFNLIYECALTVLVFAIWTTSGNKDKQTRKSFWLQSKVWKNKAKAESKEETGITGESIRESGVLYGQWSHKNVHPLFCCISFIYQISFWMCWHKMMYLLLSLICLIERLTKIFHEIDIILLLNLL